MTTTCSRCRNPWPMDRIMGVFGSSLCCLCWRAVAYPYRTGPQYVNAVKNRRWRVAAMARQRILGQA